MGTTHQGTPGPPGTPWRVVLPSEHPQVQPGPVAFLLAHKKSSWSFVTFGLHLILISCDVKNKQKTATSTGHWVNRLVPKNDIKLPKLQTPQPTESRHTRSNLDTITNGVTTAIGAALMMRE